ncbi:paired immunoglobulin-like type 2 receptor beta isoform X22 [Canis lupus familiaris]|uniref:paired immunoglobulin-like type 2 receptor beta isoform X22 n=1 Tax=Canis lupus familiaris TaxID=9615 RepID=UPI0015F13732|nr:paired immunoglobulin-like type 2 receptor beta isoform X22 [Canis lupus familiaris]
MGLSLLLPLLLLLLLTTLQAGNSARCDPKMDFRMDQPEHLSAPKGGTVHINFTFYYCGALAKDPRVSIALRRTHFHGEVIYNSTRHFVHEDYKDRIILNLPEGQKSGFLQILNLREEDENMYFCRVQLKTQRFGLQSVQSILGTKLTIYLGDPSKILRRSMRTLGFKAKLQSGSQLLITTLARHRRLRSQGVWKATKDCRETEPSAPVPSPPSQPCPQE